MTFEESVVWLNRARCFSLERYNLDGIFNLLELLNNPQDNFKVIHIAGTNGKGSVASFCSFSLVEAGFKTGLFISPHIVSYVERIQINCEYIGKEKFANLIEEIKSLVEFLEGRNVFCSQFDVLTAAAIKYFSDENCEFAVFETGMGGLLDSTNVFSSPEVAVLTKISRDHVKELGETVLEIAKQKAGIIKNGSLCVYEASDFFGVENLIREECLKKQARAIKSYKAFDVVCDEKFNSWKFGEYSYETFNLVGPHQVKNAMLATTALLNVGINEESIVSGVKKAKIPARFEKIKNDPLIFVDGAHNPDGIDSLLEILKLFPNRQKIGVFSMLKTKDCETSILKLKGCFEKVVVTQMDCEFKEVAPAPFLLEIFLKAGIDATLERTAEMAILKAEDLLREDGMIVVFGSLYFASQVRELVFRKLV